MLELPDLNAPEFAPIKARFASAYLEHKADLGVPNASDERCSRASMRSPRSCLPRLCGRGATTPALEGALAQRRLDRDKWWRELPFSQCDLSRPSTRFAPMPRR